MKKSLLILMIIGNTLFVSLRGLDSDSKKVLMHYMLWYGDSLATEDDSLRHWKLGHTYHPLIGSYNSNSWALVTYHALLSHSCGIDGIIANVKDEYDEVSFNKLIETIHGIYEYDNINFNYSVALSYDDQGITTTEVARNKFRYLRDSILPVYDNYLTYNDTAVVFIYNYPDAFLSAQDYRSAINDVFPDRTPKLCWNESQDTVMDYIDVTYSWVQPYAGIWDKENGTNWGKRYIEDYFWRINNIPQQNDSELLFGCAGVWPGFNDTSIVDPDWNQGRWMDRQNGFVYDSTWILRNNYNGILPVRWIIIETFNDWNEGTQIEPSVEHAYQYLDSTIKNINIFKQTDIAIDKNRYAAAIQIYDAGLLIEQSKRDSIQCYPIYKNAILRYIRDEFEQSMEMTDSILNNQCLTTTKINDVDDLIATIETFPNPADEVLTIKFINSEIKGIFDLKLLNTDGKVIRQLTFNKSMSTCQYHLDIRNMPAGVYYLVLKNEKYRYAHTVIVK